MLAIITQTVFVTGFVALLVICWAMSKRPNWGIRVVVYGWAAIFLWAFVWAALIPMSLHRVLNAEAIAHCFPDGTVAAAAFCTGWLWPVLIMLAGRHRTRNQLGGKSKISRLTILLLFIVFGPSGVSHAAEPRYNGKRLSKWLSTYQGADEGSAAEKQSIAAIRTIGTNALPHLTKWIASGDLELAKKAQLGFQILGPSAAPAVPVLAPMLTSTNDVLALLAGPALAHIGSASVPVLLTALTNHSYNISLHAILAIRELGTNARPAIPFLVEELNHPNHVHRERAADALGVLHIEPDAVIPPLMALLNDPFRAARSHALDSLAEFGPRAKSAAPAILKIMQEDEDMRSTAKAALTRIAPEILNGSPK